MNPKHLDLFSGIGGFALAVRWAGFETIQFVENNKFCQKVLKKHWPDIPCHDDVKTFNYYDKVDLLTGGFPCQGFSMAGTKKGFDDDRYLWPEMLRVIKQCRPAWIIAENVPGIIPWLDSILESLENENYSWRAFLIPACSIGAPHKRERLWIVANAIGLQCRERSENKKAESERFEWEKPTAAIGDVSNFCDISSFKTDCSSSSILFEWEAWQNDSREFGSFNTTSYWQKNKPPFPGVDDGLSNIVDRNKSLGNAIVPQVVYPVLKIIRDFYK